MDLVVRERQRLRRLHAPHLTSQFHLPRPDRQDQIGEAMTTPEDERIEQAITFWKGLGHKPGDACPAIVPTGIRTEAWLAVHGLEKS
jgi:hypothetical protein